MAVTYYICKKTGIIHPFFWKKPSIQYIRNFFENDQGFSGFFWKKVVSSRFRRRDVPLSGLLPGKSYFGPCFQKKFQNFSEIPRPKREEGATIPCRSRGNPSPLYSGFFGKRSVKNSHFPKKNEKSPRPRVSRDEHLPSLIFKIFRETLSKKPKFFRKKSYSSFLPPGTYAKNRETFRLFSKNFPSRIFVIFSQTLSDFSIFLEKRWEKPDPWGSPSDRHLHAPYVQFSVFAHELSIGVTARQIENWPLFSEKNSKFFRFRPSGQVRDTVIHRWPRRNPSSPLFSFFRQTIREKRTFLKKSFDSAYLPSRTYEKKLRNVPPFFWENLPFHTVYSKNFGKWSMVFPFFRKKNSLSVVPALRRANFPISIFTFFWQTIRDFCFFFKKSSDPRSSACRMTCSSLIFKNFWQMIKRKPTFLQEKE